VEGGVVQQAQVSAEPEEGDAVGGRHGP
jgi:hypothetical protein